ncbi:MAG: DUF4178 domain-containing protein [Myxococcales bacterium]|nr:DUF4178 domain-containing protein [Myxococcales bacterium]
MTPVRKADCPNCGGPIEFRLGSSGACVCSYCRFSVLRRGQALEAIGKIADLVPTAPLMAVGDSGEIAGKRFRVGGRLQLDHGKGPWDEWYVELDRGRWGWLAQAQGRFYLTHPITGAEVPGWDAIEPGASIQLSAAGDTAFTVAERGGSALLSAEGELPFPAYPESSGRYADLSGPEGMFATIDYGDGSEPPTLYVGREYGAEELTIGNRALGPRPEERTTVERLRCPKCGGPIAIFTPDSTERAACPSCQALLDYSQGALSYLRTLQQRRLEPLIPLGSAGVVRGEKAVVIGYMERASSDDDHYYSWGEYLLHTERGYRWLTEDSGHYTHLRPIPPGQVEAGLGSVKFRRHRYRAFQSSRATVNSVVGEFYWKVAAGDAAMLADYVAPPRMLSSEQTASEVSWSYGEYIEGKELWKAFDLPGAPPARQGVAPAQPNPVALGYSGAVAAALLLALLFLAATLDWSSSSSRVASLPLKLQDATELAPAPEATVVYSAPFVVENGPTTLRLDLDTSASNAWVAVAAALVNESTHEVREFFIQAEYWHGRTGGESWSEGSKTQTEYLGRIAPGRYILRADTRWGGQGGRMIGAPPQANLHATVGERSSLCCAGSGMLLLLPFFVALIRKTTFEARRWSQSDAANVE